MNNKIVMCSDLHINFIRQKDDWEKRDEQYIKHFCSKIIAENPLCIVITGDTSEYPTLDLDLKLIQKYTNNIPIYFILGNHDFYHGSIAKTKQKARDITLLSNNKIVWLEENGIIKLTDKSCLIGADGFYDVYAGLAEYSTLNMSDFHLIEDFRFKHHLNRISLCRQLAQQSADIIERMVEEAVKTYETVYIATHVSPFVESALGPDGRQSNSTWIPFFSNLTLGDKLIELAEKNRELTLYVLAGHSHFPIKTQILENLHVNIGKAEYTELHYQTIEIE